MHRIPVVAVVGPTASGKTRLGVELARRFKAEVISADSMQVYCGMDIATAKPTTEEMQGIPHHLIGVIPTDSEFSVAVFTDLAKNKITEVSQRGKLPILVGGTGLYVSSLLNNVAFAEQEPDSALREKYLAFEKENGREALLEKLRQVDPETAQTLHPNNVGRIIRALEVFETSGITISEQKRKSRLVPSDYEPLMFGINYRDRQKLYDRINLRVDKMLRDGLLEEAESFRKEMHGKKTSGQAIGYKELEPYFTGEATLEEALESLKRETRRYAKRQLTWFRRDERIHWLYADDYSDFSGLFEEAEKITSDFLKQMKCE